MAGFTTRILHSAREDAIEHGSIHKPVHGSVAYEYADARALAGVFQGAQKGYTYSRQVNPTVAALEKKINGMEGGLATVCFSTGMAAIGTMLFALLRSGDHFVSSSFLFGNTNSLFNSCAAHGVDVTFVDATDAQQVAAAIKPSTKLVFVETIANPRTQVTDLEGVATICQQHGLIYVVDNTMTTPYLYQPTVSDADIVINSLTKYIGGHGNVRGGAITDTGHFGWQSFDNIYATYRNGDPAKWGISQIRKKGLRDFGATLDAEAANRIALGAETLALRVEKQCANTRTLCDFLVQHPRCATVYYPGLSDHPELQRAQRLFKHPGAIFSFELTEGIDPFEFMNNLHVVIKSSNLGDTRTLAIPIAHTIYYEMGPERRASMGINESLIRISTGIEDIDDLLEDFENAFRATT